MKIEMKSDFPVTEDAFRQATGKTLTEWIDELSGQTTDLTRSNCYMIKLAEAKTPGGQPQFGWNMNGQRGL
jgi:hypothetical protein